MYQILAFIKKSLLVMNHFVSKVHTLLVTFSLPIFALNFMYFL